MAVGPVSCATTGGSGHPQLVPVRRLPAQDIAWAQPVCTAGDQYSLWIVHPYCRENVLTPGTRRLCLQTLMLSNHVHGIEIEEQKLLVIPYPCQIDPALSISRSSGIIRVFSAAYLQQSTEGAAVVGKYLQSWESWVLIGPFGVFR